MEAPRRTIQGVRPPRMDRSRARLIEACKGVEIAAATSRSSMRPEGRPDCGQGGLSPRASSCSRPPSRHASECPSEPARVLSSGRRGRGHPSYPQLVPRSPGFSRAIPFFMMATSPSAQSMPPTSARRECPTPRPFFSAGLLFLRQEHLVARRARKRTGPPSAFHVPVQPWRTVGRPKYSFMPGSISGCVRRSSRRVMSGSATGPSLPFRIEFGISAISST